MRRRECIVIDDAQDLNLAHLAFLKELTDPSFCPTLPAAGQPVPGDCSQRRCHSSQGSLFAT
jgi:hypothetical protein